MNADELIALVHKMFQPTDAGDYLMDRQTLEQIVRMAHREGQLAAEREEVGA